MTTLVTYASKHGSTGEIAHAIAERLRERGVDADERAVELEADLDGYDSVVLGSAVYMGAWMKDAVAFAERISPNLGATPVWAFSSGPILERGDALSEKHAAHVETLLHPREHVVFGGVVERSKLGFLEKRVVNMVKAPDADHRDWDEIVAFADRISDALV